MTRRVRLSSILLAALAALATLMVVPAAPAEARIVGVRELSPRITVVSVYSESMRRVVRNHVLHPPGKPAGLPSFYLMTGAGGAEDGISWYNHGGVKRFFANKNVNVVLPIGGRFSMMTDWYQNDLLLGRNKWQTYMTRELPAAIARGFGANGRAAIGGVSMSAGPALDLAIQAPSRYQAVAAYSGCPGTTDVLGMLATTTIPLRGGANPGNMWGVVGGPGWRKHDPIINAPRLRGKTVFLSAANGVPGRNDGGPREQFLGIPAGPSEAYSLACTNNMSNRLNQVGIRHTMYRMGNGTHSWGVFSKGMRTSWPHIARAIGTR